MNRPFILSRVNSLKGLTFAAWSWLCCYALPVLAQQPGAGQVVAAEIKGLPTHENSSFLEGLFTVINYATGIALAGALIFGLIWLLQRRNVVDDATEDTTEEAAADTSSDSSTESADSSTDKKSDATADATAETTKEATTASAENTESTENSEVTEKPENPEEKAES